MTQTSDHPPQNPSTINMAKESIQGKLDARIIIRGLSAH